MKDRVLIMIEGLESQDRIYHLRFFYAFKSGLIHVEWSDGSRVILDRKQSPYAYLQQMRKFFPQTSTFS